MSVGAVTAVTAAQSTGGLEQARPAGAADGIDFAGVLGSVEQLQQLQSTSQELGVRAVTGDLDDVHDYTIAAAQSSLALELTAAVRNKAVEAFNEIMRMQV